MWLRSKGNLKKEDQQYGEWLRAEQTRQTKKSVAVISGSARSQGPWGKKYQSASQSKNGHSNGTSRLPHRVVARVILPQLWMQTNL